MSSTHTIEYEFPLNERYRTMLKLEHLFLKVRDNIQQNYSFELEQTIHTLLDVVHLSQRTKIHQELIDELSRHQDNLNRLADTPAVDKLALDNILNNLENCLAQLNHFNIDSLPFLRTELFQAYQKRSEITCATLAFDVPLLHYWSNLLPEIKQSMIDNWLEALAPIENALVLLFHLIRQSAFPKHVVAKQSKYFINIPAQTDCLLIKIAYDMHLGVYPQISGNHQRIYLRFDAVDSQDNTQTQQDIPFELTLCSLT